MRQASVVKDDLHDLEDPELIRRVASGGVVFSVCQNPKVLPIEALKFR